MNTPSHTVPESQVAVQAAAPASLSITRPFYWSLRRELWENRSLYLAPLAASAVFLAGFLVNIIKLRIHVNGSSWGYNLGHAAQPLAAPFEFAGLLIMGVAFIVGIFYSVDALYGERRDRSILFWKSLPVSDVTVVLSKVSVPLVVIPLLSFAVLVVTQLIMLLLASVVMLGSGVSIASIWTGSSFLHVSLTLFYHLVTVHGFWYAPFYGWLLMVSAWSRRAPFLWAFLPPFVICAVEKMAFDTSHFANLLLHRLAGPELSTAPPATLMDAMTQITLAQFILLPGLWIGMALAAVFLYVAIRVRRYRGPI